MKILALSAALLAGGALAGAADAQSWGAVGISPNGATGFAYGYGSEAGALNRVYAECPSCQHTYSFANTCGAMALGDGGAWGAGWGTDQWHAEQAAEQECSNYGYNCYSIVWACSY
jgi:serine/threonine-protein kinase